MQVGAGVAFVAQSHNLSDDFIKSYLQQHCESTPLNHPLPFLSVVEFVVIESQSESHTFLVLLKATCST